MSLSVARRSIGFGRGITFLWMCMAVRGVASKKLTAAKSKFFRGPKEKGMGMGKGKGRMGQGMGFHHPFVPSNEKQSRLMAYLRDPKIPIVVATGPAGTGKTMLSCIAGMEKLDQGLVSKLVFTRPTVAVADEELGFLPGDLNLKMKPWIQPLYDVLLESSYTPTDLDTMIRGGAIEIVPLAFMRGRTFKHCFVFCDEAQNMTPVQMLMLLSRMGVGSKLVVAGDLQQTDLLLGQGRGGPNGLQDFLNRWEKKTTTTTTHNVVSVSHFTHPQSRNWTVEEDEGDEGDDDGLGKTEVAQDDEDIFEVSDPEEEARIPGIRVVQFDANGVMRSPIAHMILELYAK